MSDFVIAAGTCITTGILTILNPCPLTTTVAAITFLTGHGQKKNQYGWIVLLFVLGYLTAYLALAIVLSSGMVAIPEISRGLQRNFAVLIGPALILIGMFQSGILKIKIPSMKGNIVSHIADKNWYGFQAYPIGLLLALGFCPATAAIFFGILIPLAIQYDQPVVFPLLYALGVALPLTVISFLIMLGVRVGRKQWQSYLPVITGWILICTGIYLTVQRIWI